MNTPPSPASPAPTARLAALALLLAAAAASAQDRTEMESTRIVGNRELPRVLTVVPWRKPLPGELFGHPLPSVLDAPPEPLVPSEFRRRIAAAPTPQHPPAGESR